MGVTFLLLVIHIGAGALGLVVGLVAALARKGSSAHIQFGKAYYTLTIAACTASMILAVRRWDRDAHLFFVALSCIACVVYGRRAARLKYTNWKFHHFAGMIPSYLSMFAATLIVNWQKLPWVSEFSPMIAWIFFPSLSVVLVLWWRRRGINEGS